MKGNVVRYRVNGHARYLRNHGVIIWLSLLVCLGLVLGLPGQVKPVEAASYSYTNNTSGQVPDGTSTTQNGCAYWPATRYFLVNDNFIINDLNVEFSQTHADRGQIQVRLTAPDGTTQTIIPTSGDANDNYYITLDDASTNALNDGNADTIGGTRRIVGQPLLTSFEGKNAKGHWSMTICDSTYTGGTPAQPFNESKLVFDGTAFNPVPLQHKQGPSIVETYFVPWPEDQVWTAMGRIYNSTSCSTLYNSFLNYDANPRQPMVGYTSITITEHNTVVTYDHWEDGYEPAITFPGQPTTQVWGDGDLLNGVAPGDADDILGAGQILILNDVMLSSTLGSVVDFDARDKITSSQPVAVSRSVWADGSQTLFAAADEVYPVDQWGTLYYSPVGDNASLNSMFEYSGVSIIAATDGTLVDIDLDGNGVYETTNIALNQGETYQVDDNTNGIDRGGRIRSNTGHPIQVNLITADVCAGYESRTYPLKAFELWDSSYYAPVGTVLDNSGVGLDDAPTTVSLYNPNATLINVAYDFATGGTTVVNISANSGANVIMNNMTGAHFYSVIPGVITTNNVRDTFATQSYSRQDGSVNWATDWIETGDDGSATIGTIYINSTSTHLRFREESTTGDAVTRQVDLSGYTEATLSIDINGTNVDTTDDISVLISADGTNFTELERFDGDPGAVTRNYDISAYISNTTFVQFLMRDSLETGNGDGNYWQIDNVDITFSYTTPNQPSPDVFYAIASVDSDNTEDTNGNNRNDTYDWGITLVPEKVMSQYLIVGWAPGDDPTFLGTNTQNTAPIWLTGGHPKNSPTPGAAFDICVDFNGDGGVATDPITNKAYDRKITGIAPRSLVKIYKNVVVPPDAGPSGTAGDDQTGTQIWVCGPTIETRDTVLDTDAIITAAWGEDPLVAAPGKPGVDMGYTIRNQRTWRSLKGAELLVDLNGNGLYDEGDTIRYTILVANTSASQITSLTVTDTLPPNVTYVTGSTRLTDHNGIVTPITDLGSYTYNNLPAFESFFITFDVTINPGASEDPATVTNIAHITDGVLTQNPEVTITVQKPRLGSIGNYVWLDEDGDGDQDAGEMGIPNMRVELRNASGALIATTYTDANGGYIFTDLNAGVYNVTTYPNVNLNPTFDENGIGTPNVTSLVLTPGEEHLTADFGYNWSTTTETNNPVDPEVDYLGAIGDRVWSDVDGDGKQDPEEVGIANVQVRLTALGADGILGSPDDTVQLFTTDTNGNYIFDGLPAGAYVVEVLPGTLPIGYGQTGDPDSFGLTCTVCDHRTTDPVILGPGDVFVNADFGYQPLTAEVGSIGDTVWLDADRDGVVDGTEPRIPGVTVALINDINGNGIWDVGEPIIATDITDASGQYLFSGLPAGAGQDYLVWVNDTNNVLGELVPTYDADGGTAPASPSSAPTGVLTSSLLEISSVLNLTTAGNLVQDFGYAPLGHDAGEGLIGDTIFLDLDADGVFDAGEGLEGVLVRLYASDGVTVLANTYTNENGQYFFGGLAAGTYTVQVQTGTLPYSGLSNTVDPDGANDSTSTVTIAAGGINLLQDFGYRDTTLPNTIGGTIWNDTDADGTLEGMEAGRYSGVTVVLRDANGDIVATTVSDASGNYSFTNLPDGTYRVDVTDDANILNGTWKSTGPSAGSDNNSQLDPYTVSVSGGQTNLTADFGYYVIPAGLGNFVWLDLDSDGIQDAGEVGILNVTVILTITYPDGTIVIVQTVTDSNGFYSFGNLLLDEDHDGTGAGEPSYVITVPIPDSMYSTGADSSGTDDAHDSDGQQSGVNVLALVGDPVVLNSLLAQGYINPDYDFGFTSEPTAINEVIGPQTFINGGIHITWETVNEIDISGFKLFRGVLPERSMTMIYQVTASFSGLMMGDVYDYVDSDISPGVKYTYWLEVQWKNDTTSLLDPTTAIGPYVRYLPLITR